MTTTVSYKMSKINDFYFLLFFFSFPRSMWIYVGLRRPRVKFRYYNSVVAIWMAEVVGESVASAWLRNCMRAARARARSQLGRLTMRRRNSSGVHRNRIFFYIVSLSIWLRHSASRSMSKNETKREKMKIVIEGMKNAPAIEWQEMNVAMKAKNFKCKYERNAHFALI